MSEQIPKELAMVVEQHVVLISRERREKLNACKDVLWEIIDAYQARVAAGSLVVEQANREATQESEAARAVLSNYDGEFDRIMRKARDVFYEAHRL